MDNELRALVEAAPAPPALPEPWPKPGQSDDEWAVAVAVQRAAYEALMPAPGGLPEVGSVRDTIAPSRDGAVNVRVYVPTGAGPFPGLVMLHGGGFWVGGNAAGLDAADASCRLLCSELGAVVVNVDYRQAPEHRIPCALEDSWAATAWAAALPEVDPERLAVSGASAGGNLAAGVARLARTRGPALVLQQLLVPTLDATLSSPSAQVDGIDLKASELVRCWQYYLGPDGDATDPLASPLLAPDLEGLPPAHLVVAELDPLYDDGLRYETRLREAGVEVQCDQFAMGHYTSTPEVGGAYLSVVVDALRRALRP